MSKGAVAAPSKHSPMAVRRTGCGPRFHEGPDTRRHRTLNGGLKQDRLPDVVAQYLTSSSSKETVFPETVEIIGTVCGREETDPSTSTNSRLSGSMEGLWNA